MNRLGVPESTDIHSGTMTDPTQTLAIFPLQRVLVPGELMVLQVFEPRYHRMLADIEDDRFGVVLIRSGSEVGGGADYFEVGTYVRILERRATDDGREFLALLGDGRFRIERHLDGTPYPRATVVALPASVGGDGVDVDELRDLVVKRLRRYLGLLAELGSGGDINVEIDTDPVVASFQVASLMRLAAPERQDLLEMETATSRLQRQLSILEREADLLQRILGSTSDAD